MNRINLICLGVRDMKASLIFYRDVLGFQTSCREEKPGIVFFQNGGTRLELYPLDGLAKDISKADPPAIVTGFAGITLAYNAKTRDEVDSIFQRIERLGGVVAKFPEDVFWGGYSGYFKDPDGYYWEVAYADSWKFDENDMLVIE